jgi:hypothetical protein
MIRQCLAQGAWPWVSWSGFSGLSGCLKSLVFRSVGDLFSSTFGNGEALIEQISLCLFWRIVIKRAVVHTYYLDSTYLWARVDRP